MILPPLIPCKTYESALLKDISIELLKKREEDETRSDFEKRADFAKSMGRVLLPLSVELRATLPREIPLSVVASFLRQTMEMVHVRDKILSFSDRPVPLLQIKYPLR